MHGGVSAPSCCVMEDSSTGPRLGAAAEAAEARAQPGYTLSLGQEDPLEKEMASHSGILAWKIAWTEEPDRLQSMGL